MTSASPDGCIEAGSDLGRGLRTDGFRFVQANTMRGLLARCGELTDWPRFAASWNDLEPDTYLAGVGKHRRRRFAVYRAVPGQPVERAPHQPHYQSSDYNALQGDIERWFEPIARDVGQGDSLQTILAFGRALFDDPSDGTRRPTWHVEVHQFRIEAGPGQVGEPTPEGVHRDGVDFVLVLLIGRENVASGTTTVHTADGTLLGSFTLSAPLDAALLDDTRVFHGVTSVEPLAPGLDAHRDVLVVTWRRVAAT